MVVRTPDVDLWHLLRLVSDERCVCMPEKPVCLRADERGPFVRGAEISWWKKKGACHQQIYGERYILTRQWGKWYHLSDESFSNLTGDMICALEMWNRLEWGAGGWLPHFMKMIIIKKRNGYRHMTEFHWHLAFLCILNSASHLSCTWVRHFRIAWDLLFSFKRNVALLYGNILILKLR